MAQSGTGLSNDRNVSIVRDADGNNKLYLYDIVQIKKETSTPLE